jgi:Zinc carboxypeptidase
MEKLTVSRKSISFLRVKRLPEGAVLTWYKGTPFYNEKTNPEFAEFSILRKTCDDFEFSNDYQEYFCDIRPENADLIYQRPLECSNNRKYTFTDNKVETGCTYAYFVRSKTMPAVGPAPVKIRDPEVWWPYEELERRIDALCAKYPQVTKSICGRTGEGRNIFSVQIGAGKPFLGLVGAIHPGEAGPELIVSALEKFLQEKPQDLESRSIVAIPSVNIDMRERLVQGIPWYLRTNPAGVDLNRNFPAEWDVVAKGYGLSSDDRDSMTFRGTSPASEPETQSVINFFTANTPSCIFSFHALAGICDLPALAAGGVSESDEIFYRQTKYYTEAYGKGLHPELQPDESWLSFGGTEGGLTRWCWQKLGIPAFDLELSARIAPEALKICRADKTTPALLQEYAGKHANAIKQIMSMQKIIRKT